MQTFDNRKGRHCAFSLNLHLVFLTKNKAAHFDADHLKILKCVFESVCKDFGSRLISMRGRDDYVELRVTYPARVAPASLVNSLKGVSSRMLRTQFSDFEKVFGDTLWSPSYLAADGGAPAGFAEKFIQMRADLQAWEKLQVQQASRREMQD